MVKRFSWLVFYLLFSVGMTAKGGDRQYSSYKGLVMAGYQGWFNTPDDGSGRGWHHYNGPKGFRPGSCSIDFWPEVLLLRMANQHQSFLLMTNLQSNFILSG